MNIKKRLLALLLLVSLTLACIPTAMAAETEWDAEGIFGETAVLTNMSAHSEVVGTNMPIVKKGGRSAWEIRPKTWGYNSLHVNVKGNTGAGKNALVEVDYYDESDVGWFRIEYNGRDGQSIMSEILRTEGSSEWKTAQFILYAPTFADDLNSADFAITTNAYGEPSVANIAVGGVRVKMLDDSAPYSTNIKFKKDFRNFYSDEEIEFDLTLSNKIAEEYTLDLTYIISDTECNVVETWEESVTLKSMETKVLNKKPDFKRFGRFILTVIGENKEKGYRGWDEEEFAYIVRSRFRNDRFGVCNHLGWGQKPREPGIIYPMMKAAGIGWTRDEMLWKDVERTMGHYELLPHHEALVDVALENDIQPLIILNGGNEIYSGGGTTSMTPWENPYPTTPEGYEAFGNYCENLARMLKGRVSTFEYWNEYGWGGVNYDKYADFAKAMYEGAKRGNPDAKTVGMCASDTGVEFIKVSWGMGAGNYMDDVSYHKYVNGTPEEGNAEGNSRSVRETLNLFEEGKDSKIWLTEFGYNSYEYSKERGAKNLIREYLIHMEDDLVERTFYYDFTNDNQFYDTRESHFGMIQCFDTAVYYRYLAKPTYVAVANLNDKLGTPDFQQKLRLRDGRIYAYHFKRQQDGKDIAILWSTEENDLFHINLGTDDVNIVDVYGNPLDIKSHDGQYSLSLGSSPIFIEGEFTKFEEGTSDIYISETNLVAPVNDEMTVYIYKTTDEEVEVEVGEVPEDSLVQVVNVPKFDRQFAELKLKANGDVNKTVDEPIAITTLSGITYYGGKLGLPVEIPLKITGEGGKVFYDDSIRVEYEKGIEISGRTKLFDDRNTTRWMLDLDIESHYRQGSLAAKMDIIEPKALAQNDINLGIIKKGSNHKSIHLKKIPEFTSYKLKAVIKLENGLEQLVEFPIDFALAFKADTPPEIDGKINADEWPAYSKIVSNREDQVDILLADQPWRGKNDLSAATYMQWDDEYLYIASEVTDDVHDQKNTGAAIWQADSIQFAILLRRTQLTGEKVFTFTELGVAASNNGEQTLHKYSGENGTTMDMNKSESMVVRAAGRTYYELKLAWDEILPIGEKPYDNLEINYSMIVNDADNNGRRGWIEFGSGIGRYKAAEELARIRLMP